MNSWRRTFKKFLPPVTKTLFMEPFDTILPADSVEFCPHPDATNIFVCGTYKLEQSPDASPDEGDDGPMRVEARPQKRHGKCLVFDVNSTEEKGFSKIQEIYLPAILDMKWCHTSRSRTPLLAIADSEGQITLHEWDLDQKQLKQTAHVPCASPDVLCLSLDWSNRKSPTSTVGSLVVSLSNGCLALLQPDNESGLSLTDTWAAHDYEPWIAAWDYWDTNIIYSGGDDLKMKMWDVRQGFHQPAVTNKRFDAGVTTIQSHPHVEHIIAVGSYDNTVRVFDNRKLLTPLTKADVNGGAWRVKWHPSPKRQHDLLVACMHDGFKVVRFRDIWQGNDVPVTTSGEKWDVIERFDKHTSLAYGVDWSYAGLYGPDEPAQTLVASASFYDHAMYLWHG
ncbi:hypothetical protein EW146_g3829 [Bondarzewia mesenterica]|uniref:methylated diphthine methylhydrolase n=1 Tax=Bondarzewia mesenterica TaxID=1095465 RepID=A0A4S4LXN9_9AGAM|nr:hypothetical protein EW146_g3829 [Bondarzewia mesenterica]